MAPLQFGVLLIPFQLLDVAGPLDVLNSCTQGYLRGIEAFEFGQKGIADKGIDMEFHHIGETMEPVTHTGNFRSTPTTTCATCPPLDFLLIGGPDMDYIMNVPPVMLDFIRTRAKEVKILFTTCTGGAVAARAGILDGLNATANHGFVPVAIKVMPQVKWTRDSQWVIDGKYWTSGGACAGMDMMAHWVIENYGKDVAEAGFAALDYEPRDVSRKLVPLKRHGAQQNGKA